MDALALQYFNKLYNLKYLQSLKHNLIQASRYEFGTGKREQDRINATQLHKRSYDNLIALKTLLKKEENNYEHFNVSKKLSGNAKEISDLLDGEESFDWLKLSVEHALSARKSYQKITEPNNKTKINYAFFIGFAANILESYVSGTGAIFKGELNNDEEALLALSVDFDIECAELTRDMNYRHSSICSVNAGRKAMYLFTLTGKENYRKLALSSLRTFTKRYEDERKVLKNQDVVIHKSDLLLLKHKPLYKLLKHNIRLMVNGNIKKGTEIEYFPSKNNNRSY